MKIRLAVLGESHDDYVESLDNIAQLFDKMSNYSKAAYYYENMLEIYRKTVGENNRKYAVILNRLASIYDRKMEDYVKAEQYYKHAMNILNKIEKSDIDPDYAVILGNLALMYSEKGIMTLQSLFI